MSSKGAINFAKFKKISEDKDKVVLQHPEGHQVHVAKSALSPKMRGQLAEIPMHQTEEKVQAEKPASARAVADHKGEMKMADGGAVKSSADRGWSQSDKAAFSKGAGESGDGDMKRVGDAVKGAADTVKSALGFADGGVISGAQQRQSIVDTYNGKEPPKPAENLHQVHQSQPTVSVESEDPTETAIHNTQESNKADPAKASALDKTNAARAKFLGMADGGAVPEQSSFAAAKGLDPDATPQDSGGGVFDFLKKNLMPGGALPDAPAAAVDAKPPEAQTTPADPSAAAPAPETAGPPAPEAAQGLPTGQSPGGQPSPTSDPYGLGTQYGATIQGINEQKAGLQGEAMAMGAQGQRDAAILEHQQQQQQSLADNFAANSSKIKEHDEAFLQDIQNSHIDPQRYLGSMNTGQRVLTTIGLILGGIGQGLGAGENPAMKMLNANIDRDIDAQKTDLNKKQTLYSANLERFKNERMALEATRAQMNDMTSMQLKKSAAEAQSPIAKARALQAAGQLDQTTAALRGGMAMKMTLLGGVKNGTVPPEKAVTFMIPENQRAEATKEISEAKEAVKARDAALNAFDQIAKINTVGNSMMNPLQAHRQIEALKGPITASLSKATAGKFTVQDSNMLDSLWSAKGDNDETKALKRAQINKLVNEKMNYPTLDAWDLGPKNWGRYNSTGQSRIQESAPVKKR